MWAKSSNTWFSLFLLMLSIASSNEDAQRTLLQNINAAPVTGSQDLYDYGVGLDLSGSYGTISISYSNGTKLNIARIDGSDSYKALFRHSSLESSQYIHPPYRGWDDSEIDWPRQRQRQWNKDHGLPASEHVGVLSTMISSLVKAAESRLGHNITSALAATPNLVALYQEDMRDAFEHAGLQSLDATWDGDHVYHETSAAIAGNGLGLCLNFKNKQLCRDEEWKMGIEIVLSVLYTEDCLCVELAATGSASYVRGYRMSPPTMDFTLGTKAIHDNPSETYYWEAVRDTILRGMVIELYEHQPKKVFMLGDQSHNAKFRAVLEEALIQYNGKLPKIYDEDSVFRAAKGAAEFARRRRFVL